MGRFRDAITGLFTTRAHAEASPETTVRETRRRIGGVAGKVTIIGPAQRWTVHADGRIEGFPDNCAIINALHVED